MNWRALFRIALAIAIAFLVIMLAVAADKDLTSTPTSSEFFQGLWSIKDDNLGGLAPPLTFTQNAPATPSYCFFLMTIQNQQFVDLNNGNSQCVS